MSDFEDKGRTNQCLFPVAQGSSYEFRRAQKYEDYLNKANTILTTYISNVA